VGEFDEDVSTASDIMRLYYNTRTHNPSVKIILKRCLNTVFVLRCTLYNVRRSTGLGLMVFLTRYAQYENERGLVDDKMKILLRGIINCVYTPCLSRACCGVRLIVFVYLIHCYQLYSLNNRVV